MDINDLRKQRDRLSVKISDWKKKGKDTTELEKEQDALRREIKDMASRVPIKKVEPVVVTIPVAEQKQLKKAVEQKKKVTKATPKHWTPKQLERCQMDIDRILDSNDWHQGYQFRSSEWMYLTFLRTRVLPDSVELQYTIQYKTKNHRVERTVSKYFNPETINAVQKYIDDVELWVMLNSGDMDDKTIVFGQRFNMVQFETKKMAEQGWIIKK